MKVFGIVWTDGRTIAAFSILINLVDCCCLLEVSPEQ
jgi:hypothetical protein